MASWATTEPKIVLKQIANKELEFVSDLCASCRDIEAEAIKIDSVLLCWWCAKDKKHGNWPLQHHSIRGKNMEMVA